MANSVRSIHEAQDAFFSANRDKSLPREACPGKRKNGVKHGKFGGPPTRFDMLKRRVKFGHNIVICYRVGDVDLMR